MHIAGQLTEPETVKLAVNESAKLIPYVMNSRRTVKMYLKVQWQSCMSKMTLTFSSDVP